MDQWIHGIQNFPELIFENRENYLKMEDNIRENEFAIPLLVENNLKGKRVCNFPWRIGTPSFSERLVVQILAMKNAPYLAAYGKKGEGFSELAKLCNICFKLSESDGVTPRVNTLSAKVLTKGKVEDHFFSLLNDFKTKFENPARNISGSDGTFSTLEVMLQKVLSPSFFDLCFSTL